MRNKWIASSGGPLLCAGATAAKAWRGVHGEGADLFGPTSELVSAGVSARRRRRLPIRLMVSLL
jgi:hypothetical protein